MANEDLDIKDFMQEEVALRDHFLRKHHAAPDVESELQAFMQQHGVGQKRRGFSIAVVAVASVAAAVILLFVFGWNRQAGPDVPKGAVVAYEASADRAEQGVMLQQGDEAPVAVNGNKVYANASAGSNAASGSNVVVQNVLTTPHNATAQVVLADGTEVMLNAGSRLVYPQKFSGNKREIRLQGEAYFKVHHDASRPFIVHANGVATKVLGTEFNVRAYDRSNTHVTLLQGSVLVSASASSVRIKPGEDALFNGAKLRVNDVDTEAFTAWTQGEFYFDNESLVDIATQIGKWYNVSVIFQSPEKMHTRLFFAAPRSAEIEDVVEILNSLNKAKMTYGDGQLVIE